MSIRIGTSPITGVVYAGKLNKAGTMWVGEKQDITDEAIGAVAESLLKTKEKLPFTVDGQNYELLVIKV